MNCQSKTAMAVVIYCFSIPSWHNGDVIDFYGLEVSNLHSRRQNNYKEKYIFGRHTSCIIISFYIYNIAEQDGSSTVVLQTSAPSKILDKI